MTNSFCDDEIKYFSFTQINKRSHSPVFKAFCQFVVVLKNPLRSTFTIILRFQNKQGFLIAFVVSEMKRYGG